jgi:ATP/maltotriose-dependent transcriptional regulator MalT
VATEVIGRDEELGAIEAFLHRVREGPGALVLTGEAGIGKTLLWEAGVAEARARFEHVLSCRGVEAEASLSYAGLSDLLADVLGEVAPSLAPLRLRALEVALLLAEPGDTPPDPRLIGVALLDVLRALADHGPVLVALDDVQWLDSSSAAVLQIALRRLRDEPIAVLVTLRKMAGVAAPFELEQAFPEERLERLWLAPLSLGVLHHLLRGRLDLELTRSELARLQETSGGNPFFALELGRELAQTQTSPAAGRVLRVPESLHELLGGRLSRLPTEAGDVLLQVAALARPTVELVAAAHGDREVVQDAVDTAVREGIIDLDGSRLRFVNPLLGSICYEQAAPWKRRAVHRALADAVNDLEERARHLALAAEGPDAVVASYLEAAGDEASARGAPSAAAGLYELAAELTPADPALARHRRFRAARFHRLAGDSDQAAAQLDQLLTEIPHGVERADALFELARTLRGDPSTIIELLNEALSEVAEDEVRQVRILGYRGWAHIFHADIQAALTDTRAALEKAEQVGDPSLIAAAIGHLATAEGRAGEFTPGLIERGVEIEERLGLALEWSESPKISLSRRLVGFGELDRARAILDDVREKAAARGDERLRAQAIGSLSRLEWFSGNLRLALELAAFSQELHGQAAHGHEVGFAGRLKALAEVDLGLVEEARTSATEALAQSESLSDREWTILTRGVLGRLELALGDIGASLACLRELPAQLLSTGYGDPAAPVWADTIEALIAGGEIDHAGSYLEAYEANSRRAGSVWGVALAARCRGLLAAAEGDLRAAFEAFDRALAELAGLPFPLEHGRTLLCLGVVRRQAQQKKAAREALEQALGIFEELEARLWAEKAHAELRRISGRQPASDELTETERQVAALAAQGRSNKEIAAELFMGVSTVEAHLSHVYRKLGVRRAELAGRLAIPVDEAAEV